MLQHYKGFSTEWDVTSDITENHKYRLTTGVWRAIILLALHCYQCVCVWKERREGLNSASSQNVVFNTDAAFRVNAESEGLRPKSKKVRYK